MFQALRTTGGIADRAAEIARIGDLDEGEAGVLLVVGAKAAIVGTAPLDGGVVDHGHFRALDKDFATAAIVIDVVGDEDIFAAVRGAMLKEENLVVLKDDLALELAVAVGTDGESDIVKSIRANAFCHRGLHLRKSEIRK
jgi:hypothetical protein